MTRQRLYRRLVRRETHSARTSAAVIVVSVFGLVIAWCGVEIALFATGLPALLVSPPAALSAVAHVERVAPAVIAGGVLAFVLGVVLLLLGIVPGRRARRWRIDERLALVVDDRVVASSLSARAAASARVARGMTRTAVGRRRAVVRVTPVAGASIDAPAVEAAVERALQAAALRPELQPSVTIDGRAVVGA